MLERIVLLAAVGVLVIVTTAGIRALSEQRAAHLRERPAARIWSALGGAPDGRPGLVVFSAPLCLACRTAQEPAVQTVEGEYREGLRVLHVDISRSPDAARAFNILTAPSTVVLGPDGRVSAVNQGFASAERLREQLSAAGVSPGLRPSPRPPAPPVPWGQMSAGRH